MSWFVQSDVDRLTLSDGQFIDVKRELNAGEHRKIFKQMVPDGIVPGEKIHLDPEQVGLTKVMAYLVGWSLTDPNGQPVPISESAMKNIRLSRFQEIVTAIDAHEDLQDQIRENGRKNPNGASGENPTSESPAP